MIVKTALRLNRIPTKDSRQINFECLSGAKTTYPKFFINKYAKVPNKWINNGFYLVTFSVTYAQDADGVDEKRGQLFLREVQAANQVAFPEDALGLTVVKGIVTDIKNYSIAQGDPATPHKVFIFNMSRVKLSFENTHTYLWYFDDVVNLGKGDEIQATVKLFNKRAYDEEGQIDMGPKYTYKDSKGEIKSEWFTELELIDWEVLA